MGQRRPQHRAVAQGLAPPGEAGRQHPPGVVVDVDPHPHPLARRRDLERVAQVHRQEGRDVEGLVAGLDHQPVVARGGRQHIVVALAEGVADRIDHRRQPPLAVVAEIDRERIEAVAQQARHAQGHDPAARR
ncbi:conserved hypothetical protein [Ricinus communis]|uniref:Uncharacterized protein n=1 Tax=Ricinus communis TaxID=3988 RepID=B9TKW1_RICCO|nr:conserved hypothetical protein [Ricinus communis]